MTLSLIYSVHINLDAGVSLALKNVMCSLFGTSDDLM
jgi:hypothetical protein